MRISHRLLINGIVEWLNPRTGRWDVVSKWGSLKAATEAVEFYNAYLYKGW